MGAEGIIGLAGIVAGTVGAVIQFIYLGRGRVSTVMTAPAGVLVRFSLLVAVNGVRLVTSGWPVLVVFFAIVAWELAVQGTALARRRASRAS
jgi:hypothetical protein